MELCENGNGNKPDVFSIFVRHKSNMKIKSDKKRLFLLGAGASKSYAQSPSRQKMPIANDFFETFSELSISCDSRVLIGNILNVARDDFGVPYPNFFSSDIDIEDFHSHVESKLIELSREDIHSPDFMQYFQAYIQLVSLFASVINEIQNGSVSIPHMKLVEVLNENDCLVTFNWDTLLDRALDESGKWKTDYGYCVTPRKIFRNQWENPIAIKEIRNFVKLVKLHGSSNWITSYPAIDKQNIFKPTQTTSPDEFYVYEKTNKPYPCWQGRFEGPYEPFSYFYYPPNILDDSGLPAPQGHVIERMSLKIPGMPEGTSTKEGLTSIPLIIPPVKNKSYSLFGDLFKKLWKIASDELALADEIIVIGYSFPKTDSKSIDLFKSALCTRKTMPIVKIIDPSPHRIINLMQTEFGIPDANMIIYKEYFSAEFDFEKIS
jgi:hypothetical protein